ncbi:hypothetical protein DESA109040_19815 [Deinococcus saxicola]|uniref:arsenate reductase/protein-tyrosine-phosphatase family protein n=1 Tax=Deinococcus saxicola TaxID=249406 RepID=UPI0039F120D4
MLFICTGNTARSQVAQALLEHRVGDCCEVSSAGLEPGEMNPLTFQVSGEIGLDTSHLKAEGTGPCWANHTDSVCFVNKLGKRQFVNSTPGTRYSHFRSAQIFIVFADDSIGVRIIRTPIERCWKHLEIRMGVQASLWALFWTRQ